MKVYHVYTFTTYPDSTRVYSTWEKAQEYANELVNEYLDDGYKLSHYYVDDENESPFFTGLDSFKVFVNGEGEELRIFIDEYEVE